MTVHRPDKPFEPGAELVRAIVKARDRLKLSDSITEGQFESAITYAKVEVLDAILEAYNAARTEPCPHEDKRYNTWGADYTCYDCGERVQ